MNRKGGIGEVGEEGIGGVAMEGRERRGRDRRRGGGIRGYKSRVSSHSGSDEVRVRIQCEEPNAFAK